MDYQKTLIPDFFRDQTDLPCEALLDYFISWTLRCAADPVVNENQLLNHYAKRLLSMCIFDDPDKLEGSSVSECRTWKQSSRIDLWVEAIIDGEKYAVIFENKAHTQMHGDQLERYYAEVEQYYKDSATKRYYVYLSQKDDFNADELRILENSHFRPLLLDILTNVIWSNKIIEDQKLTGNDLFDEFWFRWWA